MSNCRQTQTQRDSQTYISVGFVSACDVFEPPAGIFSILNRKEPNSSWLTTKAAAETLSNSAHWGASCPRQGRSLPLTLLTNKSGPSFRPGLSGLQAAYGR